MLDPQGCLAERTSDALAVKLKACRPLGVIVDEHDLARLATADQNLIQVRVQLVLFHIVLFHDR